MASYLQTASNDYEWRYNFHLVSTAATTIVMYVCLVPVGLWAAFRWFVRPSDPDIETEVSTEQFICYNFTSSVRLLSVCNRFVRSRDISFNVHSEKRNSEDIC